MRRVALRLLNREKSDCVVMWRMNQVEFARQERGELIMKRVGGRMRHKLAAMNFAEWLRNYRAGMAEMWQSRNAKLQEELGTLQVEYQMLSQAGAERIMKGVAMRILHKDLASALSEFKHNWVEATSQARAEVITLRFLCACFCVHASV